MANWYSIGEGERIVASTLTSLVPRDRLVLATKAYYPMSEDPNDRGLSRKHLLSSVESSLRRMGTDYVDLFMIHAFTVLHLTMVHLTVPHVTMLQLTVLGLSVLVALGLMRGL